MAKDPTKGMGWRVSVSIITCMVWLIFLIIWLFFFAEAYTVYQNTAVGIVSMLVVGALNGAAWAPWGMKYEQKHETKEEKFIMKTSGFGWRVSVSIITFLAWMIFLIIWLFFFVDSYTMYQNIAVSIISLLVFCAVMGAAWAPWGMKYGPKLERMEKARKRKTGKKK